MLAMKPITQTLRPLALAAALLALGLAAPSGAAAYNTFTGVGSVNSIHFGSVLVPLPGGKAFLLGGNLWGDDNKRYGEVFSSSTNTFSYTAGVSTNTSIFDGSVGVALRPVSPSTTGKVLIAGGQSGGDGLFAELFDPTTGLFASTTGQMTYERIDANPTSALLPNGKVLIAGGKTALGATPKTAQLYNPVNSTFTATGSAETAHLYGTATVLADGKVLLVGGFDDAWAFMTSAELYDPTTGVFTATTPLPVGLAGQSATRLANGNVLLTGGYIDGLGATTRAYLYNPVTKIWSRTTGDMTRVHLNAPAVLLPSGKVLIIGGDDGGDPATPTSSTELYDPRTSTFSLSGPMSIARNYARAVLLTTGKVLVTGGKTNGGVEFPTASEIYTPTPIIPGKPTGKWATDKRKRLVTATVNLVVGTTYKLTAKLGRKTKTGKCKTKGAKVTCTLAPGKGKWAFSITPSNAGGNGTVNGKAIKL